MSDTDRIEKEITIQAPRNRVWRALTNAEEFGAWFRVKLEGPFRAGETTTGRMTVESYEHLRLELEVERIEPESYFAYRWHPYAVQAEVDYSDEPCTLVEFFLSDAESGTQLRLVESGFDRLPASRRELALRMNGHGWTAQMGNIERHVTG